MKTLGANSIRVYHVDPTADHSECMNTFANAGIYAWIDLDTFSTYILATNPEWNQTMYSAYSAVMDAFQNYTNTAGFFVGNEVLTTGSDSIAAPYVKAAARDMKAYRNAKGYRDIPVGYSAADIAELRPNLQNYLACGTNSSDAVDFFSLNAYEWCGSSSTYMTSGYSQLQANASSYNIPIFFSETGCNTPEYVLQLRKPVKERRMLTLSFCQASSVPRPVRYPRPGHGRHLVRRHHLRMDRRDQQLRPDLLRPLGRCDRHRHQRRRRLHARRNPDAHLA